jgi:penicillin amidase
VTKRLRELSNITEKDMLALQLDTATELYRFYQTLALSALTHSGNDGDIKTEDLRHYIENWDGRAEVESLGLPLFVELRKQLIDEIFSPIVTACRDLDPDFQYYWTGIDDLVQSIVKSERPELLPQPGRYKDWAGLVRSMLLKSAEEIIRQHGVGRIAELIWGKVNTVQMRHPLSNSVPFLGRLLDMPRLPLPGCSECVRYAFAEVGANSRMVVAAGHESEGILQLAGGQSGQLGSSHYADQQAAWVTGAWSPLLSGERRTRMILQPLP